MCSGDLDWNSQLFQFTDITAFATVNHRLWWYHLPKRLCSFLSFLGSKQRTHFITNTFCRTLTVLSAGCHETLQATHPKCHVVELLVECSGTFIDRQPNSVCILFLNVDIMFVIISTYLNISDSCAYVMMKMIAKF